MFSTYKKKAARGFPLAAYYAFVLFGLLRPSRSGLGGLLGRRRSVQHVEVGSRLLVGGIGLDLTGHVLRRALEADVALDIGLLGLVNLRLEAVEIRRAAHDTLDHLRRGVLRFGLAFGLLELDEQIADRGQRLLDVLRRALHRGLVLLGIAERGPLALQLPLEAVGFLQALDTGCAQPLLLRLVHLGLVGGLVLAGVRESVVHSRLDRTDLAADDAHVGNRLIDGVLRHVALAFEIAHLLLRDRDTVDVADRVQSLMGIGSDGLEQFGKQVHDILLGLLLNV